MGRVWFLRAPLAPRRFRFPCAVWACVLGPGLGCAPPFLAGLSGCVFCAFVLLLCGVGCWVSLSWALSSLSPHPLFFGLGCWLFFFLVVCVCIFRCPFSRLAAVAGLVLPVLAGWSPCGSLGVLSSVLSGWGVWPPLVVLAGGLVAVSCFRAPPPPPPLFFFLGGACLFLPLPSLGWRTHWPACSVVFRAAVGGCVLFGRVPAPCEEVGGRQPPSFPWHAKPQSHEIQDFLLKFLLIFHQFGFLLRNSVIPASAMTQSGVLGKK